MTLRKQYPREYRIWKALRSRCNAPCYKDSNYQKNNIKVCPRWDSFANFFSDMGPCPPKYSIDRIDNSKGYFPENCRWASQKTQCQNRDWAIVYEYNGKKQCLKAWAEELGINYHTLYMRRRRFPELSFQELITYIDDRDKPFLWQGSYYTRTELCSMYNIPRRLFYDRWHRKWSLERILLTPKQV